MTAKELFESLQKAGLENAELIYPNWIYQIPIKHVAHVISWHVERGEVFLDIDVKENFR